MWVGEGLMERREEREGVKEEERKWPGAVNDIGDGETDTGDKGGRGWSVLE